MFLKLRYAIILASFTLATTSSYAINVENLEDSSIKVKFGANINVQAGYVSLSDDFFDNSEKAAKWFGYDVDNKGKFLEDASKLNRGQGWGSKRGLGGNTSVKFDISKSANGVDYGGTVDLSVNTSAQHKYGNANSALGAALYVQGNFGKFMGGSFVGPSTVDLRISPLIIAKGTGVPDGDDDAWIAYRIVGVDKNAGGTIDGIYLLDLSYLFITIPFLPNGADFKKSNKFIYYTPTINGFGFGISYSPTSRASGTTHKVGTDARTSNFASSGGFRRYEEVMFDDIFEVALKYNNKFENGLNFSTSLVTEFGQSPNIPARGNASFKRKNLMAWELGGLINYKGFSLGLSYGSWGESGLIIPDNGKKLSSGSSYYWLLGAAYNIGKFGASVTYWDSRSRNIVTPIAYDFIETLDNYDVSKMNNKLSKISVAADYILAPGISSYAELAFTNYKTSIPETNLKTARRSVFMTGLKFKV